VKPEIANAAFSMPRPGPSTSWPCPEAKAKGARAIANWPRGVAWPWGLHRYEVDLNYNGLRRLRPLCELLS